MTTAPSLTSLEICAGGGGQALGIERAGFSHVGLVELEPVACQTLKHNRPEWNVIGQDLKSFDGRPYCGVDLLAGGVPCPPFSVAGNQLGEADERNLFPQALRLVDECRPLAVMLENVPGLLTAPFESYRGQINRQLHALGYVPSWALLNARDFGVSQLRPRVILVAVKRDLSGNFGWPIPRRVEPATVGELLYDLMASRGWQGADAWRTTAAGVAPTIVGGSKLHGGPDLGPTRARKAWAELGVDGMGIADLAPSSGFSGLPRLTVQMVARIQGFPDSWAFVGKKTAAYRQVGNAFPPPVAEAVATKLFHCLIRPTRIVSRPVDDEVLAAPSQPPLPYEVVSNS